MAVLSLRQFSGLNVTELKVRRSKGLEIDAADLSGGTRACNSLELGNQLNIRKCAIGSEHHREPSAWLRSIIKRFSKY